MIPKRPIIGVLMLAVALAATVVAAVAGEAGKLRVGRALPSNYSPKVNTPQKGMPMPSPS
jgi:hypothetical protein